MNKRILLFIFLLMTAAINSDAQLKVSFPSKDSLLITADWYPISTEMPIILLCHQNRFSRGNTMKLHYA
ncbi:MAG: hypothetical protein IPQ03_03635 [Bacteroidetes bacterium]|nr:hypothetical protein [Bacteroidota bacterium]